MTPTIRNDGPMSAAELAARLGERAEGVCRRYLPGGRKEGTYWKAGNARGDPGRSLFVGLGPPAHPGRWTRRPASMATCSICCTASSGPRAFDEARAFLGQCAASAAPRHPGPVRGGKHLAERMRRMWEMCRPIEGTLAERYLRSRHLAYTRFPALRFHPALYYRDRDRTETFRKLPALVAQVTNHRGDFVGVHRTEMDPENWTVR